MKGFASKAFNATKKHKRRKLIISITVLFVHLCGTETLLAQPSDRNVFSLFDHYIAEDIAEVNPGVGTVIALNSREERIGRWNIIDHN
jgi:hypothetical protein